MAKIIVSDGLKLKINECIQLANDNAHNGVKQRLEKLLDAKYVNLDSLKDLKNTFKQFGKTVYLHELLQTCHMHLPKYEPLPRNPELEARVQALKSTFAEQEYQEMVKNVDLNSRLRLRNTFNTNLSSTDFRSAQGQLIAIFNMVLVILGAFIFGYKSVEYALEEKNYLWQIVAGFALALIVAVADVYFLMKKLLQVEKMESKQASITQSSKLKKDK